ncbi:aspartic proteinase-like protein 2 isoform X2 [Abrus precatorius]|uniref:Aspartic proteinase-like protein 2 isoform X2 n=1 Tax=Abrus precatorius TaxID=3816 RepID=A0A8B8L7S3_ABRPR|nr:aspartic proteinase-like protein 2 isoform X2 [Abrus precatorius]
MRGGVPVLFALATVVVPATVVLGGLAATFLPLERAIPLNQQVELGTLRARDRARHGRILQGVVGGVVDFSVQGTSDPYFVGLYFTKVKLGSPAKEFYVQIDTGSDILWLNCMTCSNCPQSSGLGIQLNFFDTASSSTAAQVSCSDPICSYAVRTATSECSSQANQCTYTYQYGDGSGTSGYYVSDTMYFDMILGQSVFSNSSTIVFGCSSYQAGDLTRTDKAVDGIFGFGPGALSVISQLSSQSVTPKVFSHCLKGQDNGGGILVLGEILEPSIVYSPLVPSQPHYNLNLQSIAVNGQLLSIDPDVFATANNRGTIVDSGTTLAYLVQEAYDPFVDADGAAMWCIGFQKVEEGFTILGDLVLKDKIFVYDLANQRIGWANYDCSLAVNVSVATSKSKDAYINAGQMSVSCSHIGSFSKLLTASIVAFLVHIIVFMESQFS